MERKHLDIKRDGDWIVASTPEVDRDRDRVMPMGLDLSNYRKNPVLFYGHSYAEPWNLIGKAAEIEQDAAGLRIRAELREPASETDPMHIVKALWESGLLRAASIGFQPLEAQPNEKGGRDIQRAELLEISLVPIPANQSALRLAAKAMDGAEPVLTLGTGDEPPADESKEAEPEPEAKQEVAAEAPAEAAPATDDNTAAEEEARAELRLAAILAEFVSSIRPYLSQS